MRLPKSIEAVISELEKLPGIGPKTAERLTYHLLRAPKEYSEKLADTIRQLKEKTTVCKICYNIAETNPCDVCADEARDKSQIMVVEEPLEVLAFEKTGKYDGTYHVLHGAINPLENIGPDELFIEDLFKRLELDRRGKNYEIKEIIIATNPTMEGDATAMYLAKKLRERFLNGKELKVTRLGMGIPTGADLEYADETTLREAIEGRREM